MGFNVTDVMDRQYFTSIYFREPNGVLYEIATLPPGFAIDEPLADLGRSLKLPPGEEQRRALIEKLLPPVTY
jgi:glyoxalase family protein